MRPGCTWTRAWVPEVLEALRRKGLYSSGTSRIPPSPRMKCSRERHFLLFLLLGSVLGIWVPQSGPPRPGLCAQRLSMAHRAARGLGGHPVFHEHDAAQTLTGAAPASHSPWSCRSQPGPHLLGSSMTEEAQSLCQAVTGLCTCCLPTLTSLYCHPTWHNPLQPWPGQEGGQGGPLCGAPIMWVRQP